MVDNIDVPVTMHIAPDGLESKTPIQREAEGGALETVERPLSQRELAMQAISKRRAEAIEKELQYGEQMADDARETAGQTAIPHAARENPAEYTDATEPGAAAAPADPPEPAATQATQPAKTAAPAAEETHVVTVGNQQYKVTQAQLDQLASIGAVALEAMHRQQQQPQPQAQPQQQPQQVQQQQIRQEQARQQQPIISKEESRALAGRLQYGNEHDSAQAIADLSQIITARVQQQNPQINPHALANYAVQQATQQIRQEQALNYNLSVIGQEYPKIFASNRLSQLAALTLHENRRRDAMLGVQKSDLDLYREACHDVMTDLSIPNDVTPQPEPGKTQSAPSQAGQAQAQPPAGASRFEAKRAAPRSPIAAQRTQASEQQGRSFPTASEIVAQMKKARGQTV